jgi:signal transduction histidine kinase
MALRTDVLRVVQRLSFCRDMSTVMAELRDMARELTAADGVTVVLRDGDLCHYAEENAIAPLWKGRRFPIEQCISGWCMLHREQLAIPDIYLDPRVPHDAYRPTFVQSLAMTPIRSEAPIGAIGAYWASRHEATDGELEVLQALGDSAALAIANAELIQALEDSNRRKDEFLTMLAHELRNPLTPIRNALHILRLAGDNAETAAWAHDVMERQVRHLARLIDGLLDMARIQSGRIELHCERLDLTQLVRQAAEDRRGVLEAAGLELRLELPAAPVRVTADPARLSEALGDLLDNAGKFTPRGGEVSVRLATDEAAAEAVVTVRDTGEGIAPEMLPRVFDVFAQADTSLERSSGGLGLGLSLARGLVQLHGGSVLAESDGPGKGASFTLRIPEEPPQPAPSPSAAEAGPD